ncbi:hypothetical protein Hanom_Chr06g00550311 [Helianthus anomalus]
MAIKVKPQGPRCKRFQIWTKVAKVTKPQGPKWQFTLSLNSRFPYFYHTIKVFVIKQKTIKINVNQY